MTRLADLLNDWRGVPALNEAKAAEGLRSAAIQSVIDDELSIFREPVSITLRNHIPSTTDIPIENKTHWYRIPGVIACYVDMVGSTKLSASAHEKSTARIYRFFTNTAIRIFHTFGSPYIDVKGDGVFALFDSDRKYTALAAMVSVKTFVSEDFTPAVEKKHDLTIGGHFGIDQKTVLVRKLGLKFSGGRTDRQNEVWAGKPVNMAAKLASRSTGDTLWVSDRYYSTITADKARLSCGCGSLNNEPSPLWREEDVVDDDRFDFDTAWVLRSSWCKTHGKRYCRDLVALDGA